MYPSSHANTLGIHNLILTMQLKNEGGKIGDKFVGARGARMLGGRGWYNKEIRQVRISYEL